MERFRKTVVVTLLTIETYRIVNIIKNQIITDYIDAENQQDLGRGSTDSFGPIVSAIV